LVRCVQELDDESVDGLEIMIGDLAHRRAALGRAGDQAAKGFSHSVRPTEHGLFQPDRVATVLAGRGESAVRTDFQRVAS
jgi:hypothetical protein